MLIDRIVKPDGIINAEDIGSDILGTIHRAMLASHIIRCDNVDSYLRDRHFNHGDKRLNIYNDFPNVAPPFDSMWFEWRQKDFDGRGSNRVGVLMVARDIKGKIPLNDEEKKVARSSISLMTRWIVTGIFFHEVVDERVAFMGKVSFQVDSSGQFESVRPEGNTPSFDPWFNISLSHSFLKFLSHHVNSDKDGHGAEWYGQQEVIWHMTVSLMAINFMHCKNVVVEKSPPHPIKYQNACRKIGKPLFRYHTLQIGPKALGSSGLPGGIRGPSGLHICHGHFKTFTSEKPLLGKHVGMYWWEQQVRGSKSAGTIIKDYEVDPGTTKDRI